MGKKLSLALVLPMYMAFSSGAMAACTVTNTFVNGTTADATQVNQNFGDLTNCAVPASNPTLSGTINVTGIINNVTSGFSNAMVIGTSAANFAQLVINGGNQTDVGPSIIFEHQGVLSTSIGERAGVVGGTSRSFLIQTQGSNTVQVVAGSSGGVELGTGATSWSAISDERLKRWDIPQNSYRSAIQNLWIGDYNLYNGFDRAGAFTSRFGLRAQQAYGVLPANLRDMVVKKGDEKTPWGVSAEPLAFLALWGIKDLYANTHDNAHAASSAQAEVKTLKAEVAALRTSNQAASAELASLKAAVRDLQQNRRTRTASN